MYRLINSTPSMKKSYLDTSILQSFLEWPSWLLNITPRPGSNRIKKCHTSKPNKFRDVNLTVIGNNIYNIIMCERLFKITIKHGVKYQFGYTYGVGCQYGTIIIKTLLKLQRNHNLPRWVAFIDLAKAFDTSKHALLIDIFGKYGAPPSLWSKIKRMYGKIIVQIIIGNIEKVTDFKVGVKQGYSMAPVLFIFLIMDFVKTLENGWTSLGLSKAQFSHRDSSPISSGHLASHQHGTFTSGTLFDIFCMLYVYSGAFVFESMTDI